MSQWLWVIMLVIAGFLLGGVYAAWKFSKVFSGVLLVLALLAVGAGVAWYLSG